MLICIFCKIKAQPIDNTQLKCIFEYNYTDSGLRSVKKLVDTMMLEIGNKSCKFYSYHNYLVDSIRKISDRSTWMLYKSTPNKYTVYINYPENKTTVIDNAKGTLKYFEYIENFEISKWTILDETMQILSHTCKKATCRFRGRDYIAWYAIDIPISRGPYKFAGLPGLIMKIADTENSYSFECVGIEKTNKPMNKDKKGGIETVPTSREEFISMEKRFYSNPKATAEAAFKSTGINFDELMEQAKERNVEIPNNAIKNYNPIELEE
jgi:GLPGLI family protein